MIATSNTSNTVLRDRMRRETNDIHQDLHQHSSFVALFDGTLDFDAYVRLIERKFGFYKPLDDAIETALRTVPVGAPCFDYVRRSDLLRQDLEDLGAGTSQTTLPQLLPNAFAYITPKTVAGALYVVEGATLGGAGIDRATQKLLNRDLPDGRRYWAWCRANGRQRWQMILRHLEQLSDARLSNEDVVASANKTFEVLAHWIAPLHTPKTAVAH